MATINNIECADYNDGSFWQKVKRYCKDIGKGSLEVSIHRNSIDTGKMRRSSLDPTFLLA
ncbi:hypothetical protein KAM344_40720 [Aeromonas caviae]|uniref:hypothetical protein n=1 Tax=Aeromonas caviae TaxID=648 RepID=UPI001FC8A8D8|nr:hypothetical protein [Aeromonas caviae]GKQ68907.1 hypothetical protein KAM344_40720 [Aeromonas caviae]